MQTTLNYYQEITNHINNNDLQKIIQVLQLAISGETTQSQKQVYQMLKQIQSHPSSYLYFLYIFLNENFNQNLRYMSAITMKSALPRNSKQIHFEQSQKSLMKGALISQNISSSIKLKSLQNILISQLAISFQQVDWQLIYFLIGKIKQNPEVIALLYTIFQDLKHNSQNHPYYEGATQTQVIQELLKNVHEFMVLLLNQIDFIKYDNFQFHLKNLTQCFKLVRILTFHLPLKLSQYFKTYIQQIILPLFKSLSNALDTNSIKITISQHNFLTYKNFIIEFFQSINQISETKAQYLLQNTNFLDYLVMYFPLSGEQFRNKFIQVCKIWTNIVLELLMNDQPDKNDQEQNQVNINDFRMSSYIQVITQRVLIGFRFTKQDETHIRHEMELEHNPYGAQQSLNKQNESDNQNQQNFQTKHGKSHGSTLRKISITCIQKICQQYQNTFWQNTKSLVYQLLRDEPDFKKQQSAIILVGLVAQNSIQQIRPDSSQILQYLFQLLNQSKHEIVMASTLWAFEKLIPCYNDSFQNKKCVYQVIYKVMGNKDEYQNLKNNKNLMIKQAAVSLLDQMISQQVQMDLAILQTMLQCLYYALQHFTGRALFNVFKALSSIFQQPERQIVEDLMVGQTIKHLCLKWGNSVSKDSIMCPLIQCLSYICQNRKTYFIQYALQILQQIYPLFKQTQRKSLVLRVIDLATSIIVSAKQFPQTQSYIKIRQMVSSVDFLTMINSLILSEQKQIRHFGYGLLSDIIKLNKTSNDQAQFFIQSIAQSMDKNNSTSINNALMCLTDIIDYHKDIGKKYVKDILLVIYDFIQKFPNSNLPKIYLLNFSRMFGRLSAIDVQSSKALCLSARYLIKQISQGLRSQQKSQLTLNAFKGILLVIESFSEEQLASVVGSKQIMYFIDSFMGYKYNPQSLQNMQLIERQFRKQKHLIDSISEFYEFISSGNQQNTSNGQLSVLQTRLKNSLCRFNKKIYVQYALMLRLILSDQ